MKKKFIAVSMVLGALALSSTTLTSCVDDNESASVTAIRDAKAQQLASVAALNNAQAKAQELRAQAEADLAAAKAAYKQALADQEASEAEFLAEKYKAQLEALKAKYEAQIIQQQEEASSSEQTMWTNLNQTLTNLAKYYTDALGKVKTLNEDIFDAEYKLANAEINQEKANAIAQEQIYNINTQITAKTAQIERLKTQVGDKDALYKQMNDLINQAYKLINTDKPAADDAEAAAEKAYEEAYAPIDYTKINDTWADNHEKLEWEKTALPYIFAVDTLKQIADDYTTPEIFKTATETVDAPEGCYSTTTDNITTWVLKEGSAYLEATQKTVNAINANIKTKEDALGKATDAATGSSLYALLNKADAEKKVADAALAADPTNAGLKQDAEAKAVALMQAQEAVADGIEELTEAQNELKSYNNAIAALTKDSEQQKAYAAAVAKAVEAKENELAKTHEVHLIESAIETIGIEGFLPDGSVNTSNIVSDSEYGIAKALYEGTTTAEQAILALEKDIADYKKQLAEIGATSTSSESATIQYWDPTLDRDNDGIAEGGIVTKQGWVVVPTGILTIEQTKQLLQMEIDNLKAELEVANSLVAQYKTALENAIQNMNGDDVEVPTTPAEEETPAE